jgi:hypothetical protein
LARGNYAGRYAVPGQVSTFTRSGDGLTVTTELRIQPGSWQSAIPAPPAPAARVRFLAKDIAVANGLRVPFVRDASGGCSGFRPVCTSCRMSQAID